MMQFRPRILVVEESYPTALAVCDMIVRHGCTVAGMVGHVDNGLEFVRDHALDGAVIDSDLHGDTRFPLCEQLRKRDIPFMLLKKPVDDHEFGRALAGLRIRRVPSIARWLNGELFIWTSRRTSSGSGEGSSGLQFDIAIPSSLP